MASLPPTPGCSSSRQGRYAKGCLGMRAVLRDWISVGRESVVEERSSAARARSSGSVVVGSASRDCSSERFDCAVR